LALIAKVYKAIIISLFVPVCRKKPAKNGISNHKAGKSVRNARAKLNITLIDS
jgi:hypothetical protein